MSDDIIEYRLLVGDPQQIWYTEMYPAYSGCVLNNSVLVGLRYEPEVRVEARYVGREWALMGILRYGKGWDSIYHVLPDPLMTEFEMTERQAQQMFTGQEA